MYMTIISTNKYFDFYLYDLAIVVFSNLVNLINSHEDYIEASQTESLVSQIISG